MLRDRLLLVKRYFITSQHTALCSHLANQQVVMMPVSEALKSDSDSLSSYVQSCVLHEPGAPQPLFAPPPQLDINDSYLLPLSP